jgi:hypothetical protein
MTDTIPGKAAALCDGKKTKTYSDQANFVPFIVETGARINAAGLHFLSFVVEAGGRLGPAAKKLIDEVVAECEMSEAARKAAASKIMRAIGIEVMHKQAYIINI